MGVGKRERERVAKAFVMKIGRGGRPPSASAAARGKKKRRKRWRGRRKKFVRVRKAKRAAMRRLLLDVLPLPCT